MKKPRTHKKPAPMGEKDLQKRSPSKPAKTGPASPPTMDAILEGSFAHLPWAAPGTAQEDSDAVVKKAQRGRPTVDDARLRGQRDALEYVFETYWGDIGWQLERLRTRLGKPEDIQKAFEPIRGKYGENSIALFLRPTATPAMPSQVQTKKELTQIEATRRAITIGEEGLAKAAEAHRNAQEALAAQVKKCEEAKGAVFEASPEHRESLKEEIGRRLEKNVHVLEKEERTKAEILRRAEWAMRKAESQNGTEGGREESKTKYQKAKADFEAAQRTLEEERRIVKELKKRLRAASEEAWAFANAEAQKREAERKRLEEELPTFGMRWDGIQKTMLDQEAWLSQVELARFLKS